VLLSADGWEIERLFYPAVQSVGLIERVTLRNLSACAHTVRIALPHLSHVAKAGHDYPVVSGVTLADERGRMLTDLDEDDSRVVSADGEGVFYVVYWSKARAEDLMVDCRLEWKKRCEEIADCFSDALTISTPEPIFDRAFAQAMFYATECIADTPLGVLSYDEGVCTEATAAALPIMAFSGVHRALGAIANWADLVCEHMEEGGVPYYLDAPRATRQASPLAYGLALAEYCLLAGETVAGRYFGYVERVVERTRRLIKHGLYTPRRTADLSAQCTCYALLDRAACLAFALDVPHRGAMWQESAMLLRRRIDEVYYAKGGRARRQLAARPFLPLYYGIDYHAEDAARAIIAEWISDLESPPRYPRYSLSDRLTTVAALYRVGFHEAAGEMLRHVAFETLYGAHTPYPTDETPSSVEQSPRLACAFCQTMLTGLLGLEVHSFTRISVCLRLPDTWRHFAVHGLHIGATVLDFDWQREHLTIRDIFGRIYYDDSALCAQHIEVALSL